MRFFLLFCFAIPAFCQRLPLFGFEPNSGQFPTEVRFARRSADSPVYLTRDAVVLMNGVQIQVAGVDPIATLQGESPTSTAYNFYQGNSQTAWRTNVRLFDRVRLSEVSPGISAAFSMGTLNPGGITSIGQMKITLSVQPNADIGKFRLRTVNLGPAPFEGPGGIWFTGGKVPGVFTISVQTAQIDGQSRIPVASNLKIEAPDLLSLQIPGRNPSLPTEVEIVFPSYDISNSQLPAKASDGNRYLAYSFKSDALLARLDDTGKPVWVTVYGGDGLEDTLFAAAAANGVAVSGTTASIDLPLTANAPRTKLETSRNVFLAFFDRDTGQLRSATYGGIEGAAEVRQQTTISDREIVVGGGYTPIGASFEDPRGFVMRWQPVENRIVYSQRFDTPVASLTADANSNLYYALVNYGVPGSPFRVGVVDPFGVPQGSVVSVKLKEGESRVTDIRLLPSLNGEVWLLYQGYGTRQNARSLISLAKAAPARGQLVFRSDLAREGVVMDAAITAAGNLKVLVRGASPTEVTTGSAPLVASCPNTHYFAILSPTGQLVYSTYVPAERFVFATQNEPSTTAPASLGCIAITAGRLPVQAVAPGQLVTLTGGGFGPSVPIYTAPGADGKYPLTAGGFRVRIGGIDAPVIAVARGLIAVQVPFEVPFVNPVLLETLENGAALNTLTTNPGGLPFGLFDTGDRDNELNIPVLSALNQDGTVNSRANPAAKGSIVSVFGSGAGPMEPQLTTGGLSPIPPAGPLSESPLFRVCYQCEILYLGSAPGLSTSLVQANVRLGMDDIAGVHPYGIGIAVGGSIRSTLIFSPSGVVFVK